MVNQLHDQLGARVTLIAADGTVLANSFQSPAANGNLLDRPEVRDALALGQGANERNSVATGDEMFYVAVPFGPLRNATSAWRGWASRSRRSRKPRRAWASPSSPRRCSRRRSRWCWPC